MFHAALTSVPVLTTLLCASAPGRAAAQEDDSSRPESTPLQTSVTLPLVSPQRRTGFRTLSRDLGSDFAHIPSRDSAIVLAVGSGAALAAHSLDSTFNVLWLPTSRRAKYLAKQATDTFSVRAGDVSSAALVFFGVHQLGMPVRAIAGVNILLVSAWLLLAVAILKEHARLARAQPKRLSDAGSLSRSVSLPNASRALTILSGSASRLRS